MTEPQRHEGHEEEDVKKRGNGKREHEPVSARAESVAAEIVDAALKVHKALGPGLLESVYEACLCHELSRRGIPFQRQLSLPIVYEGMRLESGLRLDILVDDCGVVELKAVTEMLPLFEAQLLTYLKLSNIRLGFLINFNVPLIKDGLKRMVL